jgi:predicted permease
MSTPLADLRYGARVLARAPLFTMSAVAILGLSLGANTIVFSLVNAVLLRPIPGMSRQEGLVNVHRQTQDGEFEGFSYPEYRDLRERAVVLQDLAAFNGRGLSLGGESPQLVGGQLVTGNYFALLGVSPHLGRLLAPPDDVGGADVAVLSHGLWQRRFGSDPSVIGRTVHVNGFPFTVVGVASPGFTGHFTGFPFDVWIPLAAAPHVARDEDLAARDDRFLELIGRNLPGVGAPQAQAGLASASEWLDREYPVPGGTAPLVVHPVTGLDDSLRAPVTGFLALLQAVAAVVLAIAGLNLAGVLFARSVARRREMAVRAALGAGTGRLLRQLLSEALLVFALGGAVGIGLAACAADLLHAFQPRWALPLRFDLGLDWRVLGFALGLTLLAGLLCSLAPALQGSRVRLLPGLRGTATLERRPGALRGALVAGQVALSAVLLVTASSLLRAAGQARHASPGFLVAGVHVGQLNLSLGNYDEARGRQFYRDLLDSIGARPGVESVALVDAIPLSLGALTTRVTAPGAETPPEGLPLEFNAVTPRYFDTLRIPIVSGRAFAASDTEDSTPVAVVNQTLARRLWPGQDALGRSLRRGDRTYQVVGIARDSAYRRMGEAPRGHVYFAAEQAYSASFNVIVRTAAGTPSPVVAAVASLDRNLPLLNAMPLEEFIAIALTSQRMGGIIAGGLGVLGSLLAALGIHGVIAFTVARRTGEIGVRVALGATRRDVLLLVAGGTLRAAGAGLVAGTVGGVLVALALRGLLSGVEPFDVAAVGSASALVAIVTLVASYLPARRALSIEPIAALRSE